MLKKTLSMVAVLALLTGTVNARGMKKNENYGHFKQQKQEAKHHGHKWQHRIDKNDLIDTLTNGKITDAVQADLNYMIEEEKVARDVYATLAKTSGERVFLNITKSEQKHVDALKSLFEKYGIEVPVSLDDVGHFENETLQAMYDDLVAQGAASREDALEVGVIVEETDIEDIQKILDAGVPSDFAKVYGNLLRGSYKHLDAFNKQLSK